MPCVQRARPGRFPGSRLNTRRGSVSNGGMALDRAQVELLLRRCERRRRLWELAALAEAWGRAAWPGLVAVLVGLAVARACGWSLIWVAPAAALALLGSLAWALRGRAA